MIPSIKIGNYQEIKNKCNFVRYSVFVKEQNISPEIELDDRDQICKHLILTINNNPIGTGRIDIEQEGKIGRLAILKSFRNRGYGSLIIKKLEEVAVQNNLTSVWLNAQKESISFYEKLNYKIVSHEFIEANIIHIKMSKTLQYNNPI